MPENQQPPRPKAAPRPSFQEWLSDLDAITEADKPLWIRESLRDKRMLHAFGQFFFPHVIKGDEEVPECHIELIDELARPGDGAVVFPRGHAKSTWEKIDTIHDVVYALEPVIVYIAPTIGDAMQHFEGMKAELENNILLRATYGDLVPPAARLGRKWTNKHFQALNGVNVVARGRSKGRGVNIKNQRPTKIIVDDVEDDEEISSPAQRDKLHRWLYDVIFPSLDKVRGRIKMIGTVLADASELVAFYRKHGGIWRAAIENGKSIWPAYWPLERLEEERRKIGSRAFAKEYLNNPKNDDDTAIRRAWIEQGIYGVLPEHPRWQAVVYIDPQAGEKGTADEFAITSLYVQVGTPHRYVAEQKAGRVSQLEQGKEVVRMWIRHKRVVRAVGVEKVLNQTAVWQTIRDWKAGKIDFNNDRTPKAELIEETDRNIPLVEWDPGGKDKVARLQRFEADFERGEIHLRPEMEELRDQVMFLGKDVTEHDDRADSLVGALEMSYTYGMEQAPPPKAAPKRPSERKAENRDEGPDGFGDVREKKW